VHIFLTGAIQCGKSTVVSRAMTLTGLSVGGFRTAFGPDRRGTGRLLYLYPAGGPPQLDEAHEVVHFNGDTPIPLPKRFDALGTRFLAEARATETGLIIMDECGRLEWEALAFQAAVLETLDGDVPVLGVVRHGFPGWTKAIVSHPRVRVITVTPENREHLHTALAASLTAART